MTDIFDRASELEALSLECALAAHAVRASQMTNSSKVSATECCDCLAPIPEKRREAVRGCQRCITCQTEFEKRT